MCWTAQYLHCNFTRVKCLISNNFNTRAMPDFMSFSGHFAHESSAAEALDVWSQHTIVEGRQDKINCQSPEQPLTEQYHQESCFILPMAVTLYLCAELCNPIYHFAYLLTLTQSLSIRSIRKASSSVIYVIDNSTERYGYLHDNRRRSSSRPNHPNTMQADKIIHLLTWVSHQAHQLAQSVIAA